MALACMLCSTTAFAGNWTFVPRVIGSETYTSNIMETNANPQADFITEVSPGFNLSGDSSRAKLTLDYQLQNLFFANNSSSDGSHQDLNGVGSAELVKDLFYVDGNASISQQVINTQQNISLDNYTGAGNLADVKTFSVSPYLHHDFTDFANGTLRYTRDVVAYSNTSSADISNSQSNSVQAALASDANSGLLGWNFNYNNQHLLNDISAYNANFENTSGELRYPLSTKISAVLEGGSENNSYASAQPLVNGAYWATGLDWKPNQYVALRALSGRNEKTSTVTLTPNARTLLTATYRNRAVGLIPGPTWAGNLMHSTQHTVFNATYLENTMTIQQLATQNGMLIVSNPNPATGGSQQCQNTQNTVVCGPPNSSLTIYPMYSLTNQVLAIKRAAMDFSYIFRKSTVRLSGFNENDTYQGNDIYQIPTQEVHMSGLNASWALQITPRSSSLLTVGTQLSVSGATATTPLQQDRYNFIELGLSHQLSPGLSGNLDYRIFRQNSDVIAADYQENRLMARIVARF